VIVTVPTKELRDDIGPIDGVDIVIWDLESAPPEVSDDVVVPPYMSSPELLSTLAGLGVQLVQSQSIGYDGVKEALPDGIRFANAQGVHEASTAELAVMLMLAAQRGLAQFVRSATEGIWHFEQRPSLADRSVIIVGAGGVANAITRRLEAFECQIQRVARTPRRDELGEVAGLADLQDLLGKADIVVLAVPGGAATSGLVDRGFLSLMQDGALLVNVARGSVVDTDALMTELASRRLRAALDVVDPEPLPQDHALWRAANTIITPHVGGGSSAMRPRIAALVRRQVTNLIAGEQLSNVVIGN
jgi:phosphoglycerate dehydrogenase-like enzyme